MISLLQYVLHLNFNLKLPLFQSLSSLYLKCPRMSSARTSVLYCNTKQQDFPQSQKVSVSTILKIEVLNKFPWSRPLQSRQLPFGSRSQSRNLQSQSRSRHRYWYRKSLGISLNLETRVSKISVSVSRLKPEYRLSLTVLHTPQGAPNCHHNPVSSKTGFLFGKLYKKLKFTFIVCKSKHGFLNIPRVLQIYVLFFQDMQLWCPLILRTRVSHIA